LFPVVAEKDRFSLECIACYILSRGGGTSSFTAKLFTDPPRRLTSLLVAPARKYPGTPPSTMADDGVRAARSRITGES
jgi:hypothetical protein